MHTKTTKATSFVFLTLCVFCFTRCESPHLAKKEKEGIYLPSSYNGINIQSWTIKYCCEPKEYKQLQSAHNTRLILAFNKNSPTAVLAYPNLVTDTMEQKPLGFIYPFGGELSSKDGFASLILYELYNDDELQTEQIEQNVKLFNWQKLIESCREYENPWLLQQDRIKTAIKKGDFKKSDIKLNKQ